MTATDIIKYMEMYCDWGISFMPLFPRTKQPCLGAWRELVTDRPTDTQIKEWKETYWSAAFWKDVWDGKKSPQIRERWMKALTEDWKKAGCGEQLDKWVYDGCLGIAVIGSPVTGLVLVDVEDITLLRDVDRLAIVGDEYKTAVVKTGKPNGHHLYVKFPKNIAENKKGPNGEIRANGQYVVAAPSIHPTGKQYTLIKEFQPREISEANAEEAFKLFQSFITATKDIVAEFVKTISILPGIRSDWLIALTSYYKSQGIPKEAILEKLMTIPVCADKINESGERWWETYEYDRADSTGIGSIGLFVAAAAKSNVKLPDDVIEEINRIDGEYAGVYNRPTVKVTTDRIKNVKNTLQVLYSHNDKNKLLFQRGTALCRIRTAGRNGKITVEELNENAMLNLMGEVALFKKLAVNHEGHEWVPVKPPADVAKGVLNLAAWDEKQIPFIEAIINTPAIRPDGSILQDDGYDEATGLFLKIDGLQIPEIPENPIQEDAERAAAFVLEQVLVDFPFDGHKGPGASRTNALAAFLTPILRPMIKGCVPICLIDKPAPGTGASKLMDLLSIVATGRSMAVLSPPDSDDEWRKQITTWLRDGDPLICLDNLDSDLKSGALSRALTSTTWKDRTLGKSESIGVPQRAAWYATGNNLRLNGDLGRRAYLTQLNAKMARPWERKATEFKHADIVTWVTEHRGELVAALLTMARAWVVAGKPTGTDITIGGYEEWVTIVGGILAYAGLPRFLENLDKVYDEIDSGGEEWSEFLEIWYSQYGDAQMSAALLLREIETPGSMLGSMLPGEVAEKIKYRGTAGNAIKLGIALQHKKGVIHPGGLMLSAVKNGRETKWKVTRGTNTNIS